MYKHSMAETLPKVAVLIPSLDPDEAMVSYCRSLIDTGFKTIILVDDGSQSCNRKYFDELAILPECVVLRHAVNQGKGRALKTGFNYFLNTYSVADMVGIVTADADGQHSAPDTVQIALKLAKENCLVLGSRNFDEEQVPLKSRYGNRITTGVFALLYGNKIGDTQTGLRGIPYDFIKTCLTLPGERFDYEINMLIAGVHNKFSIVEVPIQTIYFEGNRATHFSAVRDSVRIYKVMFRNFFRFSLTSIVSALVDIGIFSLVTMVLLDNVNVAMASLAGTISARIVSSLFNYVVNRNIVFQNSGRIGKTMLRYYLLCFLQMLLSWLLVNALFTVTHRSISLIKLVIDFVLFFISYQVQRRWVFVGGEME